MRGQVRLLYALACLAASPAGAEGVGFSIVSVPDPPGAALKVGIWYPTQAEASDQSLALFTQAVAPGAPVDGGAHRLVVMSHGNGGSLEGHYDTALALAHAGFVVAAMTHTGDNYLDQSQATELTGRPRAVHAVIGYMVSDWSGHDAVDPAKIGMFGFSSGGLTALIAVGGVPDMTKIPPYCAAHPQTYVCSLLQAHPAGGGITPAAWIADGRIRAAVVAAPAVGFVFAPSGLRDVRIPVQLWRAGDDHILPSPDYVEPVRDALPRAPEYHAVAGADHFDFLAPCSEELARVAAAICQEHGGFDRAAFHAVFNAEVVRFFQRTLG